MEMLIAPKKFAPFCVTDGSAGLLSFKAIIMSSATSLSFVKELLSTLAKKGADFGEKFLSFCKVFFCFW